MSTTPFTPATAERINELLGIYKLPTMSAELVRRFEKAGKQDALPLMLEVLEAEAGDRRERRVERLLRGSKLAPGETFEALADARLPKALTQQLRELAAGNFLDRASNVLAFGLPGVGKTHAACALGQLPRAPSPVHQRGSRSQERDGIPYWVGCRTVSGTT